MADHENVPFVLQREAKWVGLVGKRTSSTSFCNELEAYTGSVSVIYLRNINFFRNVNMILYDLVGKEYYRRHFKPHNQITSYLRQFLS